MLKRREGIGLVLSGTASPLLDLRSPLLVASVMEPRMLRSIVVLTGCRPRPGRGLLGRARAGNYPSKFSVRDSAIPSIL